MMASPAPLSRACKGCNTLKVRCYPSSADPDTCERCWRVGKTCVPAGRRRRPRERIMELEAQVATLTEALRSQQISLQAPDVSAEEDVALRTSKRNKSPSMSSQVVKESSDSTVLAFLDSRVSLIVQKQALDLYLQHILPLFPAFPLVDSDLMTLRQESPVLLFSLITFTTSHLLSSNIRNGLIQEAMRIFASELIAKPNRCFDVVCALLVAASWFRARQGMSHVTVHQLVQLATGMAIDIGIGGIGTPVTPGAGDSKLCHSESLYAQRTWLACFVGASALSVAIRRLDTNAHWTSHHENCLANLNQTLFALKTDRLFVEIVRAERICFQISTSLALCDPTFLWDFTNLESQRITSGLRKDIDNWTAKTSDINHKPLLFHRYAAIIYLNEPVLHTSTNKLSFGSPFRQEKITETDFAAPNITGNHVAALYALKDSCHAMLDLAVEPAIATFLTTSPLLYVGRVAHAFFILAKLYISVTAPGNTYGTILRPIELQLEHYLESVKNLTASVESLNPGSFNSRILACHSELKDWFQGYTMRINSQQTDELPSVSTSDGLGGIDNVEPTAERSQEAVAEIEEDEWWMFEDYDTWINDVISQ